MLNMKTLGAALIAVTAVTGTAHADERGFNTAVGAVIGAAIGNSSGGRDGAIVGGVLGAAVGNSLPAGDRRVYVEQRGYQPVIERRVVAAPVVYYSEPVRYYPQPVRYYPAREVVYVDGGRRGKRYEEHRYYAEHERHEHRGYERDDYRDHRGYERNDYRDHRGYDHDEHEHGHRN